MQDEIQAAAAITAGIIANYQPVARGGDPRSDAKPAVDLFYAVVRELKGHSQYDTHFGDSD